jgi:hypothetical protein
MYRATCNCGKFNVLRSYVLQSWSSRKCKSCKSNFKVYLDNLIVYDYNNAGDRARSRMTNYIGRGVFKNKVRVNPKITFPPPPPPSSPIIRDVFMGYQFVNPDVIFGVVEPSFENIFEIPKAPNSIFGNSDGMFEMFDFEFTDI